MRRRICGWEFKGLKKSAIYFFGSLEFVLRVVRHGDVEKLLEAELNEKITRIKASSKASTRLWIKKFRLLLLFLNEKQFLCKIRDRREWEKFIKTFFVSFQPSPDSTITKMLFMKNSFRVVFHHNKGIFLVFLLLQLNLSFSLLLHGKLRSCRRKRFFFHSENVFDHHDGQNFNIGVDEDGARFVRLKLSAEMRAVSLIQFC